MARRSLRQRRTGRWRWARIAAGLLVLAGATVALGPRVVPSLRPSLLPAVPQQPVQLQAWLDERESAVDGLREGTRARIVWADPAQRARSHCAMVYLHGFSASQGEGAPAHQRLAQSFGCNLYLPRLPGHGLQAADALHGVQAQQWLDAAAEAVAVAKVLGSNVVLIGSSMGGALALQTAAAHPRDVQSMLLWSPLVRERDDQLQPLLWPWGAQLLLWSRNGGDPVMRHPVASASWADAIHIDGYRAITALSRGGMLPATYARVTMPVFVGYYYRDAAHQDPTVSVAAMRTMFDQLGTPPSLRAMVNFPQADNHVIASPLRSNAAAEVFAQSCRFLADTAGLRADPRIPSCAASWAWFEAGGDGAAVPLADYAATAVH